MSLFRKSDLISCLLITPNLRLSWFRSGITLIQIVLISVLNVSFFLSLHLSSSFKEEPSDVREEESHLRLRHGIHHQRHADRSQSDAEERHGVAPPTGRVEKAGLHVHAESPSTGKGITTSTFKEQKLLLFF